MKRLGWFLLVAMDLTVTACTSKYMVGGTVTGLTGSGLVLEDNGGDSIGVSANGTFTFRTDVEDGDAYAVTVATQPTNPAQICVVHNGSGTIDKADVTHVIVSCTQPGTFVYAANQGSGTISAFAIDSANGSNTVSVFSIDSSTGVLTAVGTPARISAYALNGSTGALTPVSGSPFTTGSGPVSVVVDPAGSHLYAANVTTDNRVATFAITPSTGTLSLTASVAAGTLPAAIAVDPSGNFLYMANATSGNLSVFATAGGAGVLTPVSGSPFKVGSGPGAVAID